MHKLVILLYGSIATLAAGLLDAAPTYIAVPIGVFCNTGSHGNAINAAGQVTGSVDVGHFIPHAFIFSDGVLRDLATLGCAGGIGYAINVSGQVVGEAAHAFSCANGVMTDLGALGAGTFSVAYGVNANGQITGLTETPFSVSLGYAVARDRGRLDDGELHAGPDAGLDREVLLRRVDRVDGAGDACGQAAPRIRRGCRSQCQRQQKPESKRASQI
jgi:probable HAF family extracellular repeat protein